VEFEFAETQGHSAAAVALQQGQTHGFGSIKAGPSVAFKGPGLGRAAKEAQGLPHKDGALGSGQERGRGWPFAQPKKASARVSPPGLLGLGCRAGLFAKGFVGA
jgi:hypothetical protein